MSLDKRFEQGKIIPLCFDNHFKKVFGDNNKIERLEAFLSLYFNVPIEDFKGNVRIVSGERTINN